MIHRVPVLRIVGKLIIPYILLFAFYVQFHGEYGPGGGFQAGVILAAGVILFALICGLEAARRVAPVRVLEAMIASGVLIYAGTGIATMLAGGKFLDYNALDSHAPQHGQHLGIMIVELGVGTTVSAVMVLIFFAFAGHKAER